MSQVYKSLKDKTKDDPALLADLLGGHLILQWQSTPMSEGGHNDARRVGGADVVPTENRWTHVPIHYLRPYSPTLLEVRVCKSDYVPPDLELLPQKERLPLELRATCAFSGAC